MRRATAVILLVCVAGACRKSAVPATETKATEVQVRAVDADADSDNLLNLAYGAAVISRTGERNLEESAAHAIDGIDETAWWSAPGTTVETLVFSLLAPSRITRVGITAPGDSAPKRVEFEASDDGKTWRPLAALDVEDVKGRQLVGVPGEAVARYIRVRTDAGGRYSIYARAFHAIGQEVQPPQTPPFTGCWTVNGNLGWLAQNGARITGRIEANPPIHIDGGTDNRVALVNWRQGPYWGYAALTRSRDGKTLTGLRFYEDVSRFHLAEAWFGEACGAKVSFSADQRREIPTLQRPYAVFGLAFDDREQLIDELSAAALDDLASMIRGKRVRITSYELRHDTPQANRQHTEARLQSLRAALQKRGADLSLIDFVAAGADWKGGYIASALQRLLACRIDVQFSGS